MKHATAVSIALAVLLVPLIAFGAESQTFVQSILEHVLELVVLIATPLVLLLAKKLIQVFEDKTGIDIAESQSYLVEKWVSQGIAYAEEQGSKALKAGAPPATGEEKKIMAVEFVAELMEKTGLDVLSRDALAKKVEALLHLDRLPK